MSLALVQELLMLMLMLICSCFQDGKLYEKGTGHDIDKSPEKPL